MNQSEWVQSEWVGLCCVSAALVILASSVGYAFGHADAPVHVEYVIVHDPAPPAITNATTTPATVAACTPWDPDAHTSAPSNPCPT